MDEIIQGVDKKGMTRAQKILLGLLIAVFVLGGGGLVYAYRNSIPYVRDWIGEEKPAAAVVEDNTKSDDITITDSTVDTVADSDATITPITDSGVTWQDPKALSDLKLIKLDYVTADYPIKYYQVATLSAGGNIILAVVPPEGPGGSMLVRFRKAADGKYYYLKRSSDSDALGAQPDKFLVDFGTKTDIDYNTVYSSVSSPDAIITEKNVSLKKGYGELLFSAVTNPIKVGESSYGLVYESGSANATDPELKLATYYLLHADGTATEYALVISFVSDDQVPSVTFGTIKNTEKYFESVIHSACGSASQTAVIRADISSRLTESGTTGTGEKVYFPKSADDAILTVAYESYKAGRTEDVLSRADFAAANPVFVWKNGFDEYVTFFNQKYAPLAECGKPVVYLYPEKTTVVSVKVGADITKSEPAYNLGWNVVADPTGLLRTGSDTYPYLFWEGQGNGYYPTIDSGFVVKKEDLEATLKNHLSKLGLNAKESSDFLEFWLSKMPTTPYTRLTWFGTNQMNQLAPLTVNPRPDTMIRIFLDFEGLMKPVQIPAQRLISIPRQGFTLVEWGGLLRETK